MKRAIRSEPGPLHPSSSQRTYPHPNEKVWRAITDPMIVSRWLMPNDLRAEVGHEFTFTTKPYPGFDGTVRCRVTTVDEPHELACTWSGGGLTDTTVRFRLERLNAEETFLRFEHAGFDGLLNRLIARDVLAAGWRGKLLSRQLPEALAQL